MVVTIEGADDSLIERKQKELHVLEERIEALDAQLSILNRQMSEMRRENQKLKTSNKELLDKLLIYEHDPIKLNDVGMGNFEVLYWDKDANQYETFATFYENNLETSLKDFCEEFILELKEMYMVE